MHENLYIVPEGISLIKRWEEFRAEAYRDNGGAWAIGYGHSTLRLPVVNEGDVWTLEYATEMLEGDLAYLGNIIKRYITVPITPHEYTACCSLAYNIGAGAFKKSQVLSFINNTEITYPKEKAARAFLDLNKAKDKNTGEVREFLGLTIRRITESALFLHKEI